MRRITAVIGVLALGTTLAGCWLQPGYDAAHSNWNPGENLLTAATVGGLTELWDTQVPTATGVNAPVGLPGNIYATTTSGDAAGVDAATGALTWARDFYDEPTGFTPFLGAPVWHQGSLLVPATVFRFGTVHKLNPADGTTVDGGSYSGDAVGDLAVADDRVAVFSGTGNSSGFGIARIGWKYTPQIFFSLSGPGPGSHFAIVGDRIQWSQGTQALGFSAACPSYPPGYPVPGCAPDWATDLGGTPTAPAGIGTTQVVYADSTGTVTVLDTASGAVVWTAELGAAVTGAPAVADGNILLATGGGQLVALPAAGCGTATCTPLWSGDVGGTPGTGPVAGGDVAYVGVAGDVVAFALDGCGGPTCPSLARVSAGSTITGGPIVHDGRVVVGTQDGRVVAFGLSK